MRRRIPFLIPLSGKTVFLDVTILKYTTDLRGVGQVAVQLARLFADPVEFAHVRFLVADEAGAAQLGRLGIAQTRIITLPGIPLLRRFERFHGLLCDLRYRRLRADAAAFILPEARTALWTRLPQAVMFHDFLSNREARPWWLRKWDRELYFRYKSWKAAKTADRIFTNSSHTRMETLRRYPFLDPACVMALHLGARASLDSDLPHTPPDFSRLRFLYVGSYESRKNIPALLRNLGRVAGDRPFRFDLVGNISPAVRSELQSLASAWPQGEFRFLGRVEDRDLRSLYAEAHFLLFPSLGEGFGLPLVEAMSHGLVVLAFANTCIPEITGDAAILAEDGDFTAWGRAVEELSSDPARYRSMTERARARAAEFSETKMFQRYRDFFREWFRSIGVVPENGKGP